MIKLGSNSIGKIYLGSNSIGKAYLGSSLVFQKGGSSLPYIPVDYIQTDGTAYINTGIKGNSAKSSEMKMTPVSASAFSTHLGCKAGNSRFILVGQWSSSSGYAYDNNYCYGYGVGSNSGLSVVNSITNQTPITIRTRLEYGQNYFGIKQSGESTYTEVTATTSDDVTTSLDIFLFASNTDGSVAGNSTVGTRVHRCKIYSDRNWTNLVFDGIPCYYNGEYGLWNTVTNTFFGNVATGGMFTGPEVSGIEPSLVQGYVQNGEIISSNTYVTTSPIVGNFYLELNGDYRIYSASLVSPYGNVVSDYYLSPLKYDGDDIWESRNTYGCYNLPSGYGVLVTIAKLGQGSISTSDNIIKRFSRLSDNYFDRLIPSQNTEQYTAAWQRSRTIAKALFAPLSKLPARGQLNDSFYLKDNQYLGMPYSGAREYDKFVGVDVSMRTFLSALMNRRSLLYTENLRTDEHHSDYGFVYSDDNEACTYFGVVCSAYVDYVIGIDIVYASNLHGDIPGMSKISNFTVNDIQPLDIVVTYGHVSIITDILTDKNGQKKYICWAEATSPLTKITPYSFDEFMARYNREKGSWSASGLYRYSALSSLTVEDVSNITYNDDICTFGGDYAAFREGQTIYINAKPGGVYTKLRIIKSGVSTPIDISIDSYTPDVNGYIDIDITGQNLQSGTYEAKLIDSNGNVESNPTHFEIIKAQLSVVSSGDVRNFTFSVENGTPIAICFQTVNGVTYSVHYLTEQEINNGTASVTYADSTKYAKLYVKGSYGMISYKVSLS